MTIPNPKWALSGPQVILKSDMQNIESAISAGLPIGLIMMFGAAAAPAGFLLCQGQAVSRTTYANLYAVIGTTFGVGDGSTTFNLPNLQQKFPMGLAPSGIGSTLGGTGGTLQAGATNTLGPTTTSDVEGAKQTTGSVEIEGEGGPVYEGVSLDNPPFQVVNFIIKY